MKFSLTVNNGLTKFLALLNNPRRIFLAHSKRCGHQLFRIGGINSLDSPRVFRVGISDEIKAVIYIFFIQCIACFHIFQLHSTTNVSCIELVHRDSVCTCTSINLTDTFFRSTVGIGQIISRLDASTHHFKIRNLADMRLHTGLEEIN